MGTPAIANDASSAAKNRHHTEHGYRSQQEFLDATIGRGKGDGDYYPIPNEPVDTTPIKPIEDRPF